MSSAVFLPFDTETGGIGQEVSLLSAHFAICDGSWNIIDELDLLIKPNDRDQTGSTIYKTTASALEINHIDLIKHDKVALTYSDAGGKLRDFLWRNTDNGKVKVLPMGKNIGGDVLKVTDNILGKKTWVQYVSYRHYDLTALIIYLKRTGRLPLEAPDSLEGLARFLGIEQEWHTAKGDNLAGIEVVRRLEAM